MAITARDYGISHNATGEQKKYNRIRKEYGAFVTKVKQLGRNGDDLGLYEKLAFFDKEHELERHNARHDPPTLISSAMIADGSDYGAAMSSSRKRIKRDKAMSLEEADKRNEQQHKELLNEIRAADEHRALFINMFAELI